MADDLLVLAAGSVLDAEPELIVRIAADAGFDAVGLRPGPDLLADRARLDEIAALSVATGATIHDVEVHRIGPAAPDPRPLLDASAALGARAVLVVSDLPSEAETEERLGALVQQCRQRELAAALEYMAWTTPADPRAAIHVAESTGAVVVVDLLHHHRVGAGVAELAEVVASGRLGWVQLADAPVEAPGDLLHEARHERLPPGHGELPLTDLLAVIPAGTPISVEVQSDALAASSPPAERAALLASAARAVLNHRR
jgi:sugar phosphate isomerase/epimerase